MRLRQRKTNPENASSHKATVTVTATATQEPRERSARNEEQKRQRETGDRQPVTNLFSAFKRRPQHTRLALLTRSYAGGWEHKLLSREQHTFIYINVFKNVLKKTLLPTMIHYAVGRVCCLYLVSRSHLRRMRGWGL